MAETDLRLTGRVFIHLESDPFAFVDGDDVRCPETGDVHPAFLDVLDRFGMTYADISTSGSGVHVQYVGDLPGEQGQTIFEIDTGPWGANDSPPTVEIYANKRVCVTSGKHVKGTSHDVKEWDSEAVEEVLDEYDVHEETEPTDHDTNRDRPDLKDYDPDATGADDTAEDIRDVFTAVDGVFYDHKHGGVRGPLILCRRGGDHIEPMGPDWWDAIELARDAGAPIPEYDGSGNVETVAVLPPAVRHLSTATTGWDWKHAADRDRKRLTVREGRERTVEAIVDAYERRDQVLIEALPTMGKSYGAIKAAAETDLQVTIFTSSSSSGSPPLWILRPWESNWRACRHLGCPIHLPHD